MPNHHLWRVVEIKTSASLRPHRAPKQGLLSSGRGGGRHKEVGPVQLRGRGRRGDCQVHRRCGDAEAAVAVAVVVLNVEDVRRARAA